MPSTTIRHENAAPEVDRNRRLLLSILTVGIVAIVMSWGGVRQAEYAYLEKEALGGAVKWAVFIQDTLSDLDGLLIGDPISTNDQRVFEIASNAGNVFRYKVFGPDGLIVFASRASDVGKTNIKPYFSDLVKNGRTFVKIEDDERFGDDRSVVSEAYVPIMKHDRFRGAIEVYVDMTGPAIALRDNGNRALAGLLLLLGVIGGICGVFVRRNILDRDRELREVYESRERILAAEEKLQETHARTLAAEAQLRDAQRLESLGRLAGGLAHELNNMLQPAITLAQLTLKKETLEQETRANLETILQASEGSREIVRKALTFGGAKSAQKEEIVLSTCLKEVVDFSRVLLPSTVEVELEIAEHPQLALINRTELTQIITNLMTNAARAMNCEGTLTIALTVEELLEEDAAVQGLPDGAYFKMLVSDNGRGMSDDVQTRLFDPYFTTAEAWENVGLGLTVVHGIIREWHGKISVWSKPDQGTCFTLFIPVAGA